MKFLFCLILFPLCVIESAKGQFCWTGIGSGCSPASKPTYGTMAIDHNNNLWINNDTSVYGGISRWNGHSWNCPYNDTTMLFNGVLTNDGLGNIYSLVREGFATSSPANRIAKWNGTSWSLSAIDTNATASGFGNLCAADNGNVYAVTSIGFDSTYQVDTVSLVEKWNGASWITIGHFKSYLSAGGSYVPYIDRLNCDQTGNVYAFAHDYGLQFPGDTTILKYDGTQWSTLPTPPCSGCQISALYTNTIDAHGNMYVVYDSASATYHNIYKWNGSSWSNALAGTYFQGHINSLGGEIISLTNDGTGNLYFLQTEVGNYSVYKLDISNDSVSYLDCGGNNIGPVPITNPSEILSDACGTLYLMTTNTTTGGFSYPFIFKYLYSNCTTGIDGIVYNNDLKIWPNPYMDKFSISVPSSCSGVGCLTIIDALGERVCEGYYDLNINSSGITIDGERFPSGMYFCELRCNDQLYKCKIVKQ